MSAQQGLAQVRMPAAALAVTAACWRGLRAGRVPGGRTRWERTNHAGEPVTLLEGVALVAGVAGGAVLTAPPADAFRCLPVLVASLGAGAVGAVDDLDRDAVRKGLAGHLGALARGEVTTGAVKILGLGAAGLLAVHLQDRSRRRTAVLDVVVGGAVVAGSANLANLLDLRPGRALKAAVAVAAPLALGPAGSPAAQLVLGAAAALLPDDLRGHSMLGDTGANPLGALVGLALVDRTGRAGRVTALAVLTALTLASERVSFTRVIESTPVLREVDFLGRPAR